MGEGCGFGSMDFLIEKTMREGRRRKGSVIVKIFQNNFEGDLGS